MVKLLKTRDEDVGSTRIQGRASLQQLESRPMFFEPLLMLIMHLYSGREDAGHGFWSDAALFRFVKWAGELRSSELRCVYFDMMGAIGTGQKSAQRAFDLYNVQGGQRGALSWESLFFSLRTVADCYKVDSNSELPAIGT